MLNIGGGELLIILLVALIFLGPTRLPEVARQVGQTMTTLRGLARGFQAEMEAAARPDPLPGPAPSGAAATNEQPATDPSGSSDDTDDDVAAESGGDSTDDVTEESDDDPDGASQSAAASNGSDPIPTIKPFASSADFDAAEADADADSTDDAAADEDEDVPSSTTVPAADPVAIGEAARQQSADALSGNDVPDVADGGPVDLRSNGDEGEDVT